MSEPTVSGSLISMRETKTQVPLVYIVVLNYNGPGLTLDCVGSVLKIDYPNFRVLVVDNASTDGSAQSLRNAFCDPRVELLVNDTNEGYAGGNNRGIEKSLSAGANYIFILNNDTIVNPGCLRPLVEAMERDLKIGIAGCPIVDLVPGLPRNYGQRISLLTGKTALWADGGQPQGAIGVDYICGAAIMLRAETIRRIGEFEPRFFLLYEDADICFRARKAGYKICSIPGPSVQHLMSRTTRRSRPFVVFCGTRNRAWLIRRHGTLLHWLVFNLLSFSYFYPRGILGLFVRREFVLLRPMLKGIWEGHWGYPRV